MATVDATKHGISHAAGGSALQERNSLSAGVPLKVRAGHFFAVVLAKHLPAPDAAGSVRMKMRMMEYALLECFVPEQGFPNHQAWSVEVEAYSQMVAELDNLSVSWDPCSGDDIQTSLDELRIRLRTCAMQLPAERRILPLAKLALHAPDTKFEGTNWDVQRQHQRHAMDCAGSQVAMAAMREHADALPALREQEAANIQTLVDTSVAARLGGLQQQHQDQMLQMREQQQVLQQQVQSQQQQLQAQAAQQQALRQQQQQYGSWQPQQDWWASDQPDLPAGTSPPYGASAFINGVWQKGDQLFFGPMTGGNLVTFKAGTNWGGWTSGCYGQLAHNISGSARNKWCTTPVECWARGGFDAHDRPDGVTIEPDQCKVAPRPFDIAGWKKVFPPPGTKVGSTSTGDKGAGGKGGGEHGKGGKGKGGKSGKGKGKGKGEDTRSSITKLKHFSGQRS